jgi:hypothetical protein
MEENTAELKLTRTEETIIISLQSREREIAREVLLPLQEAFRDTISQIETRLGLEKGAIGTTHVFDHQTLTVKLAPEQSVVAEEAEEVETKAAKVAKPRKK